MLVLQKGLILPVPMYGGSYFFIQPFFCKPSKINGLQAFSTLEIVIFLRFDTNLTPFFLFWCQKFTAILSSFAISFSILALSPKWLYTSIVTSK